MQPPLLSPIQRQLVRFDALWCNAVQNWPSRRDENSIDENLDWTILYRLLPEMWDTSGLSSVVAQMQEKWAEHLYYNKDQIHITICGLGMTESWRTKEKALKDALDKAVNRQAGIGLKLFGLNLLRNTLVAQVFLNNIICVLSDDVPSNKALSASFASSMLITQMKRNEIWRRKIISKTSSANQHDELPQIATVEDSDIEDIFEYEKREFPGHHATKTRLREWRDHDLSNFMCIKVPGEEVMGYYILFFLKPASMQRFLSGELLEDDICASDLIQPTADNYSHQTDVHICVFASKRHFSLFTVDLLWHLLGRIVYLGQFGRISRLYAEATTPEGQRILERFKFKPCHNPDYKGDSLFQLTVTPAIIKQWQEKYTQRSFSYPVGSSI